MSLIVRAFGSEAKLLKLFGPFSCRIKLQSFHEYYMDFRNENWADVCFSRASLQLYIFASVIFIFRIEIKSIYDCTKIELVKKKIKNAATPDKLNWIFDRSEDGCRQMRTDCRCKTKTIIWSTDTQQQSAPEGGSGYFHGLVLRLLLWCSGSSCRSALLHPTLQQNLLLLSASHFRLCLHTRTFSQMLIVACGRRALTRKQHQKASFYILILSGI